MIYFEDEWFASYSDLIALDKLRRLEVYLPAERIGNAMRFVSRKHRKWRTRTCLRKDWHVTALRCSGMHVAPKRLYSHAADQMPLPLTTN